MKQIELFKTDANKDSLETRVEGVNYIDLSKYDCMTDIPLTIGSDDNLISAKKRFEQITPQEKDSLKTKIYSTLGIKKGAFSESQLDRVQLFDLKMAIDASEYQIGKELFLVRETGHFTEVISKNRQSTVYDTRVGGLISVNVGGKLTRKFDDVSFTFGRLLISKNGKIVELDYDNLNQKQFKIGDKIIKEVDAVYDSIVGFSKYRLGDKYFMLVYKQMENKDPKMMRGKRDMFTCDGQALFGDISMYNFGDEFQRPRYIVFQNNNCNFSLVHEAEDETLVSFNGATEFKEILNYGKRSRDPRIEITTLKGNQHIFKNRKLDSDSESYLFFRDE